MSNNFICFDTESAQGRVKGQYIEELLEISILNAQKENIFYHRFKPQRLKKWSTSIHHITPTMVQDAPSVSEHKEIIESIIRSADYVIGFSLIDDFKALKKAGIESLEDIKCIELRHLYWYCIGRHENISFYSGPGLSQCAHRLNVNVIEEGVHTADGDTRVTLDLFFALMELFIKQEQPGNGLPSHDSVEFMNLISLMLKRIDDAKFEYDRDMASGYILVAPAEGGYRFIQSKTETRENEESVLTIPVNARKRAAYELESMFSRKRILNSKVFRLTTRDFDKIKEYTNEFDNQEKMYEKLVGLQRAGAGIKK